MGRERWLPEGYPLEGGERLGDLYVQDRSWQLYASDGGGQALAVEAGLHGRWLDCDWLEPGLFRETEAGCLVLDAPAGSMISSLLYGPYPSRNSQAEGLVNALRRCRARMGDISFADGLYISRLSLVLPTFTGEQARDELALGRWLTGGVNTSVADTERMRKYAPWLLSGVLERLLEDMGLEAGEGVARRLEAPPELRKEEPVSVEPRRPREAGAFTLPGRPEVERFFREQIIDIVDHEAEYRRMGLPFPGPTLLYGPSGCGKTFAVDRLVKYLNWPAYYITSGSVGSKYIHETSRKVSEIFDRAIANAPSVIVIDELEAFLSSRDRAQSNGDAHLEEVAEFLRRIPDAAANRVLLLGMTNMRDVIDPAILRRGRFDHQLELGPPSREELLSLLISLLEPLPTTGDLGLEALAGRLEGRPISDASFIVREAGRMAVQEGRRAIDAQLLSRACDAAGAQKTNDRKRLGFQ